MFDLRTPAGFERESVKVWIVPWKVGSSPWRRGPPRHVCLGEPKDSECGLSGPPKQACDCPSPAFVACLGSVHGLVCDCCGLLRGPLCDLFECVMA